MKQQIARLWVILLCGTSIATAFGQNLAGDMALSTVLIDGEEWQLVAEGYGFTDGPCSDAEGNFYFTDYRKGTNVFKVGADGKVVAIINDVPNLSGLKFGPDGRLYACQALKRVIAFELPSGKMSLIAEDVQPNDLVVTRQGGIYITETAKHQVTFIDAKGAKRAVGTDIKAPNGLTLSPDQGTLVVADSSGTNLWSFRVEADGGLSFKQPYMTVMAPAGKDASSADGMTTDTAGRYYAATAVGVQMFDATGRLGGVIAKPQNKFISNVTFAGPNLEYLYVTCSDKVYRRKTKAKGVLFFQTSPARAN
jgi:gluconolactonase